jgi:hypothetical protein
MSALNPQQFGAHTGAGESLPSSNGQGGPTGVPSTSTTTTVTVKGSTPSISTRSS